MDSPGHAIPDDKDKRFSVLSYEQVRQLHELVTAMISIHGRGNFPTIEVQLTELLKLVKKKLEVEGVRVQDIRLNGSGASAVLSSDPISYNDLDLIFTVDLTDQNTFERIKSAVLDTLLELLPAGVSRQRMSSCSLKEAYVSKMVKVYDSDRWSLITLGNNKVKSVELKFVNTMRRQYEFSVDSFHIRLDPLLHFYECNSGTNISENLYPTIVGESVYGDFQEALHHLHKKLIASKKPEQIQGGGLLKYCNLLCQGYRPANPEDPKSPEMYMCSRFFIDFPTSGQQKAKLEKYLTNHFQTSDDRLKYHYLMILYQVVEESTVCLMKHEHRTTLSMIEDMAFKVYKPSSNYPFLESTEDPNLLSPASSYAGSAMSTSSSTNSTSTSGLSTPQKPSTPIPLQQQTPMHPQHIQPYQVQHFHHAPVSCQTFEVITSCQPSVMYYNNYYYTTFVQPTAIITHHPTSLLSSNWTPQMQIQDQQQHLSINWTPQMQIQDQQQHLSNNWTPQLQPQMQIQDLQQDY